METPRRQGDNRPRLALIIGGDDADLVGELLFAIGDRAAFVDDDEADRVLVVVSRSAVNDPRWIAEVAAHDGTRLLPLALGSVTGAPDAVGTLNWILFDADDLVRTAEVVVEAAQTDVGRYRARQALEADARLWDVGGRDAQSLILDLGRIRDVDVAVSAGDPLAQPNALAMEFLAASRVAARRRRRRRVWGTAWRSALAIAAVVALVTVAVEFRGLNERLTLARGTTDQADAVAPMVRAVKAAGVLYELGEDIPNSGALRVRAVESLAEEWALAMLGDGELWDSALNDAVLTDAGLITADGAGTITWWGDDDSPDTRVQVGIGPLYKLAATPDASVIVVAGGQSMVVVDEQGHAVSGVQLPSDPSSISVSDDGRIAAAVLNGVITVFDGSSAWEAEAAGEPRRLVAAPSTLMALSATSDEIVLTDLGTGVESASWTIGDAADGFVLAEVDYDPLLGLGYAAGPGQQLWRFANGGAQLQPTGLTSPTAPTAIEVTPQGWALVAAPDSGVALHFPEIGVTYGAACSAIDDPTVMSVDPDGRVLACGDGARVVVFELDRLGPVEGAGTPYASAAERSSDQTIVAVTPVDDGVQIEDASGETYTTLIPASAVALGPAGTLALAAGDRVFLIEATSSGLETASPGTTPGGGVIEHLVWSAPDELLATTTTGLIWRMRACDGCLSGMTVVDVVADRITQCWGGSQLDIYPSSLLRRLSIRECESAPAAKVG